MDFARDRGDKAPQFVPSADHELQPLGSADAQVDEAMRLAKERNSQPEVGLAERIAKMDGMYVATAVDFLDGLSPFEREKYLLAEKQSKGRKQILGRYGW